jgi:hypothetical protein
MIPSELPTKTDISNAGKRMKAVGSGVAVTFLGGAVLGTICGNGFYGGLAGIGLGVVTYMVVLGGYLTTLEVMQPPAKLYNLTPLDVLAELKGLFNTQYFGDRKWHLDNTNQEKLIMSFVFKHAREVATAGGEQGPGRPEKQEALVTLTVQLERVADGTGVDTTFRLVHGTIDFDLHDIVKQTSAIMDAALKAQEATKHQ